jgi:23S rRNA G2069 N7-methylase RlmK/C1962 C5-methylase RlmI
LKGADLRHHDCLELAAGCSRGQTVFLNSMAESARYAVACLNAGSREITAASPDEAVLRECRQALADNGLDAALLRTVKADALEALARMGAARQDFGLVAQGVPVRQKGRGGVFEAATDTPALAARALQRAQPGGNILIVAADCGFSRDGLAALAAQAAALAGADTQLRSLGTVAADFPVLESFAQGLDFRMALLQVHRPGTAELTALKGRAEIKTKKKKSKRRKISKGKSPRHA